MTAEILNILKYQNRGMIMKKKLKGFTLLELVIVMAIFSVIAVGAMAMIRPAMQLFNKTASQEGASADIDNISRYIQDNLKYADRVNVYYGYGQTSVSGMLNANISGKYTKIQKEGTEWKKVTYESTPLQYFRDYYFSSSADYAGKNINVMEIIKDGHKDGYINIYTYSLETGNQIEQTSINDDFYNNYTFSITDWEFSPPNMTITMNIEYNGVTKGDDGKNRKLNQEKKIGLTFLNISQRSEFNVIERGTVDSGDTIATDATDEYSIDEGKISSRPASAYNYFAPETLPDEENLGNTYIIYTVPEIIIP